MKPYLKHLLSFIVTITIILVAKQLFHNTQFPNITRPNINTLQNTLPEIQWLKQFGGPKIDHAYAITLNQQSLFVTGRTSSNLTAPTSKVTPDIYIASYQLTGQQNWLKQYKTNSLDSPNDIAISNNQIIITGHTTIGDIYDSFINHYDLNGKTLFSTPIATPQLDHAHKLAITPQNTIHVCGTTRGNFSKHPQDIDGFLFTLNTKTNTTSAINIDSNRSDYANDITIDLQNHIYITGATNGAFPNCKNAGKTDAFLIILDANQKLILTQQIGTPNIDLANSIQRDSKNNIYIAGQTMGAFPGNNNNNKYDLFIAKFDLTGEQLWLKQFGTNDDDACKAICIDKNDNIYIAGHVTGSLNNQPHLGHKDAIIIKLNPHGQTIWVKQLGTNRDDTIHDITVDEQFNLYIAGETTGQFNNQSPYGNTDAFIAKIKQTTTTHPNPANSHGQIPKQ